MVAKRDASGTGAASARLRAAAALQGVWAGRSLDEALQLAGLPPQAQAHAQWLAYGAVRWALRLDAVLKHLLGKPLKNNERMLHALLLAALYELRAGRTPPYAVVNESVAWAKSSGKPWAAGLINAVLRRYLRERDPLEADMDARPAAIATSHPAWFAARLQSAYPEDWPRILDAGNAQPPLVLRVNPRQLAVDAYLDLLRAAGLPARRHPRAPAGLVLDRPVPVEQLPGWRQGWVSVQDAAAQQAAVLLAPQPGERILDACAAPGGKTAHILEHADVALWAVDISPVRLRRIGDNLRRLGLPAARLVAADAARPDAWWDGRPFDRILLDAPCSGTGVIRRHPDIKLLRRATDIAKMAFQQQNLLEALWPLLKPGGRFVYATCSILPEENQDQIESFLMRHAEASLCPLPAAGQILPGTEDMDGFYYAVMDRRAA